MPEMPAGLVAAGAEHRQVAPRSFLIGYFGDYFGDSLLDNKTSSSSTLDGCNSALHRASLRRSMALFQPAVDRQALDRLVRAP
jgi:hypothetical protein